MKMQSYLYRMVAAALLLGLILLFGLTPLGMWNFGVVYITLLCVPVIIGTLALGLRWGLLLAFGFGTVSLITGLRSPSGLVAPILSANVIWVIILCYVPRLIVPVKIFSFSLSRYRIWSTQFWTMAWSMGPPRKATA